jgi:hypothetical protein
MLKQQKTLIKKPLKQKEIKKNKNKEKQMNYFSKQVVKKETTPQLKITDTRSTKHFGILLTTQQSIEEFQAKSGMDKAFTTEYQFHYWALVARIKIQDEILDIALPTVMFNYKQEVNGAAVDFHLKDVEEASTRNANLANVIAGVLIESSFGQFISSSFPDVEWINVPMNTCHVHPGTLSSFSGTDYSKTISDPGICFPLSEPQGQSSFSSIICHDTSNSNKAKLVRTEYRNATKVENEIQYLHGTCFAYIRDNRTIEIPFIQSIFTMEKAKVSPSYINKDGTVVLENNEMMQSIVDEFNKLQDWSANTDDIIASRITSKRVGYYNGVYHSNKTLTNTSKNKKQGSFDYWHAEEDDYMTLTDLRNVLITTYKLPYREVYELTFKEATNMYEALSTENDQMTNIYEEIIDEYSYKEVNNELIGYGISEREVFGMKFSEMKKKLLEFYIQEGTLNATEDEVIELTPDIPSEYKMTPDEMLFYLLAHGHTTEALKGKSIAEIEFLFNSAFEQTQEKIDPRSNEFIS